MSKRTVIHLHILETGEDYYFGSLRALCVKFGKEKIGISYSSLRNRPPKPDEPYRNKFCVIRKGILEAMPTNRGQRKKDEDGKE